jgi:hypothetical protein
MKGPGVRVCDEVDIESTLVGKASVTHCAPKRFEASVHCVNVRLQHALGHEAVLTLATLVLFAHMILQ